MFEKLNTSSNQAVPELWNGKEDGREKKTVVNF